MQLKERETFDLEDDNNITRQNKSRANQETKEEGNRINLFFFFAVIVKQYNFRIRPYQS